MAASSKWNFLRFRPGLVGGHCIGVDPYYLTHKAQEVGYHPEIILAGRRINDSMGSYVVSQLVKRMTQEGISVRGARALVMGITFKEDTPDMRNSRVLDIIQELTEYSVEVEVCDPWADPSEVASAHGITLIDQPERGKYDAIVLAVGHEQFRAMDSGQIHALGRQAGHVVYDLKHILPSESTRLRL